LVQSLWECSWLGALNPLSALILLKTVKWKGEKQKKAGISLERKSRL